MIVICDHPDLLDQISSFKNCVTVAEFTKWSVEPFLSEEVAHIVGLAKARREIKRTFKLGKNRNNKRDVFVYRSPDEGMSGDELKALIEAVKYADSLRAPTDWEYVLVEDPKSLTAFVKVALACRSMTIDVETNYDTKLDISNPYYHPDPKILMAQFHCEPGGTFVIPYQHPEATLERETKGKVSTALRRVLTESKAEVILAQNCFYDRMWIKAVLGVYVPFTDDTMLLHQMASHAAEPNNLGYMLAKYLKVGYKDMVKAWMRANKTTAWADVPISVMAPYGAWDARGTYELFQLLQEEIGADVPLLELYRETATPVNNLLNDMTNEGLPTDMAMFRHLSNLYQGRLAYYDRTFREMLVERGYTQEAATDFNMDSYPQIGTLLYDRLGLLEIPNEGKNRGKKITTADALMAAIALDPIILVVIMYKKYKKLHSTFVEAYGPYISWSPVGQAPVYMHPGFRVGGTMTGRVSSSYPNGQNIVSKCGVKRMFIPGAVAEAKARVLARLETYGLKPTKITK